MRRKLGTVVVLVATAVLGGLVARTGAAAPPAPKENANLVFEAKATPTVVEPGKSGVVVVTGTIRKTVHVYPDKFKVTPKAADGVTYGKPEIKTKATDFKDVNFPDEAPEKVWFDKVEIEIPFTVAETALYPLKVGADFKWSCCDEEQCYAPETTSVPVVAELPAPAGWVRPAGAPPVEPATAPVAPPVPADPAMEPGAPPPVAPAAPAAPAIKPAELTLSDAAATVLVRATEADVTITFTPAEGYHLYPPGDKEGDPIVVKGVEDVGIRWRNIEYGLIEGKEIEAPFVVKMPYAVTEDAKTEPVFVVHWQGCNKEGRCAFPFERKLSIARKDGALTLAEVVAPAKPAVTPNVEPAGASIEGCLSGGAIPASGKLFAEIGNAEGETQVQKWWRELGLLMLGPVFLTGLLLAFTPCVLPLIPITVSIIGGTAGSKSRGRLTFLLGCYVAGLALAFGTLGLVASLTGGSMAAAFQSPIALWIIAGVFVVLAFGMFGVYELQPPAWMQRLQGGAAGGSPIGAFLLGAMGAVIASPCTGPVIAAMIVFTAQSGNVAFGFLMFLSLGLGMGSVLFAAGSLNLVAKPGPWMVWVRYGFGIVIIGVALYYLADARKISPRVLFVLGGVLALAAAVLLQRHLIAKEGEESGAATRKGIVAGVGVALATLVVALLTRPPNTDSELKWIDVSSREQLCAEVRKASKEGKGVCVDFWANWCYYCKKYDEFIESRPDLRLGFEKIVRLRVNLSNAHPPWEDGVREALAVKRDQQPYLVFLTAKGEIVSEFRTEGPPKAPETEEKFTKILKAFGALK